MTSLQLPEQPSISSASSLLVTFVTLSSSVGVVSQVVHHRGKDLVEHLLKGIAGGIDRSQLDLVSNVLSALVQHQVTQLAIWLKVSVCCSILVGFYPVGGQGEASQKKLRASPKKTSSFPPVYSYNCTVVVIVLTCGLIASPQTK